jgi:hypothetical protein
MWNVYGYCLEGMRKIIKHVNPDSRCPWAQKGRAQGETTQSVCPVTWRLLCAVPWSTATADRNVDCLTVILRTLHKTRVCLSVWFKSTTIRRIGTKFGMGLYHLGLHQNYTFEFPTIGSNKMADEEILSFWTDFARMRIAVAILIASITITGSDNTCDYHGHHGNH